MRGELHDEVDQASLVVVSGAAVAGSLHTVTPSVVDIDVCRSQDPTTNGDLSGTCGSGNVAAVLKAATMSDARAKPHGSYGVMPPGMVVTGFAGRTVGTDPGNSTVQAWSAAIPAGHRGTAG